VDRPFHWAFLLTAKQDTVKNRKGSLLSSATNERHILESPSIMAATYTEYSCNLQARSRWHECMKLGAW